MSLRKILILFPLLLTLFVACVFGQESFKVPISVTPPSPNASALFKFNEIPVSHYTGIPSISIPIYDIKEGKLSIPISLNYHASGIKVEEIASNTGLGWSLMTGGVISRKVVGLVDDQNFGYLNGFYSGSVHENSTDQTKFFVFANGKEDSQPDEFYFSIPGKSGKFTFNREITTNSKVCLFPFQKIKIEHLDKNGNPTINDISQWVITSDDGVKYIFDQFETSKTFSIFPDVLPSNFTGNYTDGCPKNPQTANPDFFGYNSSWYLGKVVSPGGDIIEYEYDFDNDKDINTLPKNLISFTESIYSPIFYNGCDNMGHKKALCGTEMAVKYRKLRKIKFSNGEIEFVSGVERADLKGSQVLDEIIIRSKSPSNDLQSVKRFKFNYGYFENKTLSNGISSTDTDPNYTKRLVLLSLTEKNGDQTISKPPYSFDYYIHEGLPSRFSFSQDHWGYFNGETNSSLVPHLNIQYPYCDIRNENNYTCGSHYSGILKYFKVPTISNCYLDQSKCPLTEVELYDGAMSREPSGSLLQAAGTLKKITYPTGGSTEFLFEPNEAFFPNYLSYNPIKKSEMLKTGDIPDDGVSFLPINNYRELTFEINNHEKAPSSEVFIDFHSLPCGNIADCPEMAIRDQNGKVFYSSKNTSIDLTLDQNVHNRNVNGYWTKADEPLKDGVYKLTIEPFPNWDPNIPGFTTQIIGEKLIYTHPLVPYGISIFWREASPDNNTLVGGLRIKKITNTDKVGGKEMVKSFEYHSEVDNSKSSGRVINYPFAPGYGYFTRIGCTDRVGNSLFSDYFTRTSSINSPLISTHSNWVGYGEVTVKYGENGENGKSVYNYTTSEDFPDPVEHFFPWGPFDSKDWKRGLLKESKDYEYRNNTFYLINKTVHEYSFHDPDPNNGNSQNKNLSFVKGNTVKYSVIGIKPAIIFSKYTLYSGYVELKRTIGYKYNQK